MKYYIWSIEHGAWWMPDSKGYTKSQITAGRYSFDAAVEIVSGANRFRDIDQAPNEAMVPV